MASKKAKAPSKPQKGGICAIYARYSSHSQKDASIEQQVDQARAHAQALGLEVVEVYADRAVSGKTDKRPAFQRMMHDAEKGRFQFVVAWKSNRIGRNMMQAMINEARLNDCGVRCLYTEEDFDDTAAGRFALRSMMNVNQFYVENMAEDIQRGLRDNAMKCMVNTFPGFGYRKGEDGRFALDPPKDAIAREIFTRVACGESLADVGRSMNERGIKTARGGEWNRSSFHRMLTSERYRGVYVYQDIRIEGGVPRIVSDEVFYKVQEVIHVKQAAKGRHRPNGDYLLTGKLFCGYCKTPMVGISGTGKSGVLHHYYVCKKRREDKNCKKENVRKDAIEYAVAKAIQDHYLSDEVLNWIADKTLEHNKKIEEENHISILEDELDTAKRSIANLMTAIEQGIITESTKARLLDLEAEQSRLSAKIASERADIITIPREDIIRGLSVFRGGDAGDKRYQAKLIDAFVVAVYLYDDSFKIALGFGSKEHIPSFPIDTTFAEKIDADHVECSFKLLSAPRTTAVQARSSSGGMVLPLFCVAKRFRV